MASHREACLLEEEVKFLSEVVFVARAKMSTLAAVTSPAHQISVKQC